ncbi:MAG: tetratricopeptide repeat-containing sensor histidine kinase [Ignavibacteria bacterium]|nr:tetratricopeptide repeat-containing sensor histidine kinase [Ignavibacteria bacterium]
MLDKKFSLVKIIIILFLFLPYFTFSQTILTDSLENLIRTTTQDSTRISARLKLINIYVNLDSTKFDYHTKELFNDLNKVGFNLSHSLLFEIGKFFEYIKNDYQTAIKYYEEASAVAKKLNDYKYIEYDGWLGYIILRTGDYLKARELLLSSISIAENNQILEKLPRLYLLTAFSYRDIGDYDKAEEYFNKTIEISNKIGDSTEIHNALHEIGNIFHYRHNFLKAYEYHSKALEIRERLNLENLLVYSYHDISNNYIMLDSLPLALEYVKRSEKLAEKVNNKWMLFYIYETKFTIHHKLNNFKEAKQHLQKMQTIAESLNMKSLYSELYYYHYYFNKSLNNFEDALKYHELYLVYKDSIANEDIKKNISELDKRYETAKKDIEILKSQENIKRQQLIIYGGIVLLVILIISLIIILKQYKQIKKTNLQLAKQKDEIQTYAIELDNLNKTKDKLFSIIAHDLRSPFTVIQGFANILIEDWEKLSSKEIKEYLGFIYQSSVKTVDLLEKLLIWAKNQLGQISFKPETTYLKPILEDTLNFLKGPANYKNIEIIVSVADNLQIFVDKEMLKTILRNLIYNSIKFTNKGGKIYVTAQETGLGTEIKIQDNGIGMSKEIMENLFNLEKKKTVSGTLGEKGSGLGLVICNEFIKIHKGSIKVESQEGQGTTFILLFPLNK